MGYLNDKLKAYRVLLKKELAAAMWYQLPVWGPLIGHIGGASDDGKYPRSVPYGAAKAKLLKPTYKPIEVITDFKHLGSWVMDCPIYYPLTDTPIYGDNPALGNEEKRKWAYSKVLINQLRKPVMVSEGAMGDQALTPEMVARLMKNAKEELADYNRRWQSYAPYDAIFKRFSANVLAAKAEGGFGDTYSLQSHPNFYTAGAGQVTWNDTAATYESNIATAINSVTDTASDHFSTTVIKNLRFEASKKRIRPVQFGKSGAYYILIINPAQALQLSKDTEWLDAQKNANARNEEINRLFTGVIEGIYAGCLVLVDQNIPGVTVSGSTVSYGNSNPLDDPIDTSDKKMCVLLGASAVMAGYAKELTFKNETWDYDNKKSEASSTIVGYTRADIYDDDGFFGTAGNFKENTSSLVCATFSPNSPAWT